MKLITILGPTATGKTSLAAHLAYHLNGEIISGDSRQVYKGMTIGTGKDLDDYIVHHTPIPYHLIDIHDAGFEYNIHLYQYDFHQAYQDIIKRNKQPILCGGSGLYVESVLRGYNLPQASNDATFLTSLENKTDEELIALLASLEPLHNTTDSKDRKRLIHAIDVATQRKEIIAEFAPVESIVFGTHCPREVVRERITKRLRERLEQGMIDEAQQLLNNGLTFEQLKYYGLEYKFLALYLEGTLSYNEMFTQLNTSIHQFAKRQMTWFRRMERNGITIHWIDQSLTMEERIKIMLQHVQE